VANIETNLKRQKRLADQLCNLFDNLRRFHWSHDFYLEARGKLYDSEDYRKSPRWLQEYLSGVEFGLMREVWRGVVFSYEVRGKRLAIDSDAYRKVSPQYVSKHCTESGAYVWRDAPDKLFISPGSAAKRAQSN
jgi:hypothetical protein